MIYVNDKNQAEKWFDNSLGKQFNPDLFLISILRLRKYVLCWQQAKGYKVYTLIIFHLIIKQGLKNTGK